MPFESNYSDMIKRVQQYHTNQARVQAYAPTMTPEQAKNVADTSRAYPYVDPKTAFALGTTGRPDTQLSRAVAEANINKKGGGFWSGGVGGVVSRAGRIAIRSGFAAIETPFQFVGAVGRNIASTGGVAGRVAAGALTGAGVGAAGGALFGGIGALPGAIGGAVVGAAGGALADDVQGEANNPFMQTTLGQVAGQAMKGEKIDIGSGYFSGGKVHEQQVKRSQEAASINGHAVTGGRLLASAVVKPGSTPYNFLSGVIDATMVVKYDPVNMVGRSVKAARQGGRMIVPPPPRSVGEQLMESVGLHNRGRAAESSAKRQLERNSGLLKAEANVVDTQRAIESVKTNPDVVALTEKWAGIDDVYKIKAMSNNKIPLATAAKIADAPDQQSVMNVVVDAINNGDILEKKALEEGKGILSTVRAAKGNAKLFALMPRGAIDFTDLENNPGKLERGWIDFENVMKNGGADLPTRTGYLNRLARVTTSRDANRVVQDYLLTDLQGRLTNLLLKDGVRHSPEKIAGVKKTVDDILGSHAKDRDLMLKKLHDEIGSDAVVDSVVMEGRLYPVAKAHTVSELFEEVVDIPDPRALRRITHESDAMRALMMSPAWDWSVTRMDNFMSMLWRPAVLLRPAFTIRVLGEETARMLAAGMDAPLMHPFSIIAKMLSSEPGAIAAAGLSGDAHAVDDAFKTSMLTMNSINHDAGIMSKHVDNFLPHTPEGGQAWAGHVLNLHKDELSRHIVENGPDSAKEFWWSGAGREARESYSAKTGRELTKAQSDEQVERQVNWIHEMTSDDPRLLHAVSAGFIPTEAQMSKGATGIKWVPNFDPTAERVKALDDRIREVDAELSTLLKANVSKKAPEYKALMDERKALSTENLHMPTPDNVDSWKREVERLKLRIEEDGESLSEGMRSSGFPEDGSQPQWMIDRLAKDKVRLARLERQVEDAKGLEAIPGHWDQELDQPLLFHGSQAVGPEEMLREVEFEGDANLVGPGFYTTENPNLASTYASGSRTPTPQSLEDAAENAASALVIAENDLKKTQKNIAGMLARKGNAKFSDEEEEFFNHQLEALKAQLIEDEQMVKSIKAAQNPAPAIRRMTWKDPENPPQMLDLEKPLPPAIRRFYEQVLEDSIKESAARRTAAGMKSHTDLTSERSVRGGGPGGWYDEDARMHAEMLDMLKLIKALPPETKGFEIVQKVIGQSSPLSATDKKDVVQYLQGLKIDGYKHMGGVQGGEKHQVHVFFDPFKLGPAEVKIPHKSVFQPPPGSKGIPLMRTDGRGLIHPQAAEHMMGLGLDPKFKSPKMVTGAKPMTTEAKSALKRVTDHLFENIMAKPTNQWVRMPAFNQAYWQKVEQVMPLLSVEAKAAVMASMDGPNVQLSSRMRLRIRNAGARTTGGTIGLEKAPLPSQAGEVMNAADIKNMKPTDDMIARAKEAKIKAETELEASPYFDPFGPEGYAPIKAQGKEAYDNSLQEQLQAQYETVEVAAQRMGIKLTANNGHPLGDGMNHIDTLAKGHAVKFIQETFEGLSDRNAIEEATRLIAPFGHAWRQAGQKWVKVLAEDPTAIRKAQKVMAGGGMEGGEDDGEGFFYKNDRGEWVFNYPASGLINKIVTGNPAPLQAQVGGLSMMAQSLLPGAGPFVSIAASKFLPNTPKWDGVVRFLAPMGDPTSRGVANAVLPPWAMRAKQAFDSPKMAGMQANTTMEMARYLVSTGKYSTKTEAETEKLMEAAGNRARSLTMLRALGQFFLPSTPTPVPMAQDENGDTVVAQLLLEEMRGDPDKGIEPLTTEQFMEKYGDRGLLFLQSNSRPVTPGLTETDKGYDFLRQNPDIAKALPLTAGLFAPPGGKFDLNAYHRGIAMGDRQRLTPKQMIELAHDKYASMIYYTVSDEIGPKPSKGQQASLRALKQGLMKKYPGFNTVIGGLVEKAKVPQVIAELEKAVTIPKVRDSDIGKALGEYLEVRTALNEIAKARGLTGFQKSARTADLRVIARAQAGSLAEKTPAFAVMFDRVLGNELADEEE